MIERETVASPKDVLTDGEVIARVLAGDTAIFELLMRRYNQRVYRCVRGIVKDDFEAQDVMQQAYVNAFAGLASFQGRSSFSTWLTRIALNEALARVKPGSLRLVGETEESIGELRSPAPDPEHRAAAAQMGRIVELEVAALPVMYRSVLLMREIEGLTTGETAECLGISEDTVKTRLHRARTLLRDQLYQRAGVTFDDLFTFGTSRCDGLVETVLRRISAV
jgi:RNA polymerase sigma-70 factor (ECF subfamily)